MWTAFPCRQAWRPIIDSLPSRPFEAYSYQFILPGTSFASVTWERGRADAGIVGSIATLAATIVNLGYLYGTPLLYEAFPRAVARGILVDPSGRIVRGQPYGENRWEYPEGGTVGGRSSSTRSCRWSRRVR
jgi:hypothetical protein